jgi:DNA-binding transcriptional LysR family regulator
MFEIRELRHLISIDEFRHFGRAAKAVDLSQPALTKSLQRMEQVLGANLFERSRARVVPTAIGNEVLVRARRLVDEAADLKRKVDSMTGAQNGSVAVGVGPAMAETYVATAIATIAQQYPHTQIAVRVDHWRRLSDWLQAGELDFYVADVGEARIDRRFQYTRMPPQQFVWFCRRAHPLARRRKRAVSRSDLVRYPIATPKLPSWATEWFAAAFSEQGVAGLPHPFPAVECESYAMLKRLVSSSECISAALQQTLARELEDGSLAILPVDAPVLTTRAGIVQHQDRTLSPLATHLVECIEKLANSASTSSPLAAT